MSISSNTAENETIVVQAWPMQLTRTLLASYTNWSNGRIEDLTKRGEIKAMSDGRSGSKLWYRKSVDEYMAKRFSGSSIDDELEGL